MFVCFVNDLSHDVVWCVCLCLCAHVFVWLMRLYDLCLMYCAMLYAAFVCCVRLCMLSVNVCLCVLFVICDVMSYGLSCVCFVIGGCAFCL